MARRLRRVRPDDQLTLVEHLDELRSRIIVVLVSLTLAIGLGLAFSGRLLHFLTGPINHKQLLQTGVGEAFLTSVSIAVYGGLLVTLPIITYQLYSFVIPAFSEQHHRMLRPLLVLIPALFIVGVVFGWYLVLPPALHFLLNYNEAAFNVQLKAREYIQFVLLTLMAMGLVFELPVVMLILGRLGIVTSTMMRRHWRISVVVLAFVAVILPGADPITMIVEYIPLLVLYGLSYFLVRAAERGREEEPEPFLSG
jgi:sec-independent protein translocase protein TatC